MKKISLLLIALLTAATTIGQAHEYVNRFRTAEAVRLRTPLQCRDSVDFGGERFSEKALLKTPVELGRNAGWNTLETADTTGFITLPKAENDYLLYRLRTRLRSEAFMKSELKITSNARFEVLVNGESKKVKESVQDSVSKAESVSVKLRTEPEKDYDIVIKLLTSADDKGEAPALRCEIVKDKDFKEAAYAVDPDMKRRLSLHETAFGSRISLVSLSHDGKYLLMTRYDNYAPNRAAGNTELIEVKSGKRLLHRLHSPAWMPRSNKLYYTATAEHGRKLIVLDPVSGIETTVAENIPEGSFVWSPTEDYLVFRNTDKGDEDKGPLKRILMPDDRIPGARNRGYISIYDFATGTNERLTFGHEGVSLHDISQDGQRLLCSSSQSDITVRPFSKSTLFELDRTTMQADTLVREDAFISSAQYSPDGRSILVIGSPEAFSGIGKNCGEHPIANDYDKQAFLLDRGTGDVKPLTREFNPSIERADWNRADNCIYFTTTDKDCRHVYRYDTARESFAMLPLSEDVVSQFSLAKDAPETAAYIGGGSTSHGVAYLYNSKKQLSTQLADPMAETLSEIELGHIEPWNFTAADGTEIEGLVCLPPQFDENRTYPLIVYYYGGTTPTTRSIATPYSPQLFASRDYVVYVIQPSGTIGYGQEFSARHVNAWGEYTADNIIEGTQKFCEAHPFVDPKRTGCLGASYGGFMTMYLQTRTDIFAAAVSHAGISNVTSYWGEGYWGYSYNSVAAADSYPWSNPELFTQHGSLFNADKITTPLLLLHGSVDTNVPIGESIQLYNALKILGREVEFITVNGENHFISDYPKRELWHNSIMAWFARWLQDDARWWNDLYPEKHW